MVYRRTHQVVKRLAARRSAILAAARDAAADGGMAAVQIAPVSVRTTTIEFQKRTTDPELTPQRDVSEILALGGGVPILAGNEVIGGVGSSGSSQTQDDACAKAGVDKFPELN